MATTTPWKEEKWMPGVLNKRQMIALMNAHLLLDADKNLEEDASALDLHLMDDGYKMLKGSIKPFNKSYSDILADAEYAEKQNEIDGSYKLEKGNCYIFRIKEKLHSGIRTCPIFGQATAKSSIGRVDVIARLIVDGMKEYEKFNPKEVDSGEMFLEITPITFDIRVRAGASMSQLRFFYGSIDDSIITDKDFIKAVLNLRDEDENHGTLSVDISNALIDSVNNISAAAYEAKDKEIAHESIDLWKKKEEDRYSQSRFWTPKSSGEKFGLRSIEINEGRFYILRSKERISLPEGVCIYCRAMDETLGEMRIHYAGFVHPLFGDQRDDGKKGTPLIFEVRGHNVKVLLTHGEILARLFFYRMSESVNKTEYYKQLEELKSKSEGVNNYNNQELKLSNFFKENWS